MIKTYCDICGKETATDKHTLFYRTAYGGEAEGIFDICKECFGEIRRLKVNADDAFIKSQGDYTKALEYLVTHNKYA